MIQEYKKLLTLGVACFIVFVLTMLPARVVFALFMPSTVQGFGIEGSIWNGSARIINVAGQQLRNTEWDLAVGRLLLGQLGGNFKTRWGSGFAEGFGSISMTGTIRLSDTQASFDVALLNSLIGIPKVGGQINLNIGDLIVTDNWPQQLTGSGEIRNLSSPLMGNGAADLIGNVAVEFDTATETDTHTITGQIQDTGGPLELSGTILLTPPGNYNLKTRLKSRPDAPKELRDNLQFLGSPESDGSYIFGLAGSI